MSFDKIVVSGGNGGVKRFAALHLKKERQKTGLFLLEGGEFVTLADSLGWKISTLLVHERCTNDAARFTADSKMVVNDLVMQKICKKDNPQPIVGVMEVREADVTSIGRHGVWLALEQVRDPGNMGTIIRTAAAAGVAGIVLVDACCDPFSVECVRASMGAVVQVPLVRVSKDGLLEQVKACGARLLGTHVHALAQDYRHVDYTGPVVLAFGNESDGLSQALTDACDGLVKIPMMEQMESLNVAVSAALVMYKACDGQL